ncbi:MAG: TIGR04282 family arsenosugar biosynthesis glycosyltransferase [Paracoccaceae bacterium]
MTRTLIIMVKAPQVGHVKTRLGRDIGRIPATWWYRHQVARTLRRLRDPRWRIVLAVAPDTAVGAGWWPLDLDRAPQRSGDLGERMRRQLAAVRGPAVLIGSDIPDISRAHIIRAFDALGWADAVFGPAEDGGYWLVGLRGTRAMPPAFLRNVRWSAPETLADSLASLDGLRPSLIDTLRDVDTGADLNAFRHDGTGVA